ncbi:MAG: SHOCT domain-containing protein [Acidimicrobiales bacterium]
MLLATLDPTIPLGAHGPRFIFPLFFLLVLGGLGGWLLFRLRGGDRRHPGRASALHTLQERFSRGEIDHAEYEHRRAVLLGEEVIPPAGASASTGSYTATDPAGSPDEQQ